LSSPPNTITGDELAVADLNDDEFPDVVARNVFASPRSVAVFLNPGGTTFPEPAYPETFIDPKSLNVGDLDGDHVPDLAVVGDGVLLTYRGNGVGGFEAGTEPFELDPDWFLLDVRLGDVDDDGDLDLVALSSAVVLVSLNNGTGAFSVPVATTFAYEDNGVEIADVDGDGRDDVVVMRLGVGGGFSVLFGLGGGQLSAPVETSFASGQASTHAQDFALGDLNEDGLPDLVFPVYNDNAVHVWLNQGDGTFRPRKKGPLATQAGRPPLAVAIGDYNNDGKPDIAAGVLTLNQVWTWLAE
jgi:hypothetical protein